MIYPKGAFIYDHVNQINIIGDSLDRPLSINRSTEITRDELLIELIGMGVWIEH